MIVREVNAPLDVQPSEQFRDRLRRLRQARAWSQEHLAERAEIDRQTVSGAENGRDVHAWVLERLADALEVTMDVLWRGEPSSVAEQRPQMKECPIGCGALIPGKNLVCHLCWKRLPEDIRKGLSLGGPGYPTYDAAAGAALSLLSEPSPRKGGSRSV